MSSKAITERRDEQRQVHRWQAPAETSPSLTYDIGPVIARWVGAFGLALLVFGGVAVAASRMGSRYPIAPEWGGVFILVGLGALLFHAANDYELQVRRVYMFVAYLWLGIGALVSVVPIGGGEWGSRFLPFGVICLMLGLLFMLGFLRNETELKLRDLATYVLGSGGVVMAVTGFLFSNIYPTFLFSHGVWLIALGLCFLWAFIGQRGIVDDLGYRATLGVGALGAVVAFIAVVRWMLATWGWGGPHLGMHFLPSGMVLLSGGLAYLALAAGLVSDWPFVVMTRRELASFFHSPLAYFLLLLFTVVAWVQFLLFVLGNLYDVTGLVRSESPMLPAQEPMLKPYVFSLVSIFCVIFQVPVMTMRLLSEEKRTGTLEMTLTAPQEETTVVLSKFAAALFMFVLMWAPFGYFLIALRFEATKVTEPAFDYQPFLAWLIVLVFTGAGFISMGLFFSSVTSNQLTAAVFTFVGMIVLVGAFLLKRELLEPGTLWDTVLTRVSFIDVWWYSLDGKLGVGDLLYHLSVTVFWLFLTVKVLESRKWR